MPILVLDNGDGSFKLLDGFKRVYAHKELGLELIEAFICDFVEYNARQEIPFLGKKMRAYKGGQPYEEFGLFEGKESPESTYEDVHFLSRKGSVQIEVRENIHIHWGEVGRFRLEVGRRDFLLLADAITKAHGQ